MFDDTYNGMTLDEAAAEAGGFVAYYPGERCTVDYDMRELSRYCRERGVEPFELPEEELVRFVIRPIFEMQRAM